MSEDVFSAAFNLCIAENVAKVRWEHAPDVIRLPNGKTFDGYDRNQFDMWKEAWQVEASRLRAVIESHTVSELKG